MTGPSEGGSDAAVEENTADGGAEEAPKPEAAKPAAVTPEQEAVFKERCGKAFDNSLAIMEKAGAPAPIVAQMRSQRDKTTGTCLEQAKTNPSGAKMIDCMLAAQVLADLRTCTRQFGDVKPLKPPAGVGEVHEDQH